MVTHSCQFAQNRHLFKTESPKVSGKRGQQGQTMPVKVREIRGDWTEEQTQDSKTDRQMLTLNDTEGNW